MAKEKKVTFEILEGIALEILKIEWKFAENEEEDERIGGTLFVELPNSTCERIRFKEGSAFCYDIDHEVDVGDRVELWKDELGRCRCRLLERKDSVLTNRALNSIEFLKEIRENLNDLDKKKLDYALDYFKGTTGYKMYEFLGITNIAERIDEEK